MKNTAWQDQISAAAVFLAAKNPSAHKSVEDAERSIRRLISIGLHDKAQWMSSGGCLVIFDYDKDIDETDIRVLVDPSVCSDKYKRVILDENGATVGEVR